MKENTREEIEILSYANEWMYDRNEGFSAKSKKINSAHLLTTHQTHSGESQGYDESAGNRCGLGVLCWLLGALVL